MKVYSEISKLLRFAQDRLGLPSADVNYARNAVLDLLGLPSFEISKADCACRDVDALLESFSQAAVSDGIFAQKDSSYYCDKVMGILSQSPFRINETFREIYEKNGPKAATDWFYRYCADNSYVKKAALSKNPRFEKDGLVVTINLTKPEFRDPEKAKSGNSVAGGYPSCVICRENEGYAPRGKCALRTVDIKLGGEDWFWQYSPYGYFAEHGIAVNCKHVPMRIDKDTFVKLLDFADAFPHYFIGCNAPLERIGGSVLSHDHFQGGGEILPLHKAGVTSFFLFEGFEDVNVGIVDFPNNVVRLSGGNRKSIEALSELICGKWRSYDNAELNITSGSNGIRHSEISPTVYKRNGIYHMNIILRNNAVSEEFPDGIFHVHPEFHMIKKESIGLIEAQGLFILPGRLQKQLNGVEELIESGKRLTEELSEFKMVYDEVKEILKNSKETSVHSAMQTELADVCRRILKNTAVFKNKRDFENFLVFCGAVKSNYEYKVSAAGRVNVIGEHVDYCGGKVLPAALSLKNTVYARKNGTDKINVRWTTLPDTVTLDINRLDSYADVPYANYIAGCANVRKKSGRAVSGCDLLYDCGVPFGSGLSSSAAIEVSTLAAFAALENEKPDLKEIALSAQSVEKEYVGVNCGIMDQYASAHGKKGKAMLLDCKALTHKYVPLELGDFALVIIDTNKPHSLVTGKYNERREETEKGLKALQTALNVSCLAEVKKEDLLRYGHLLEGKIKDRVEHVVGECSRVEEAEKALNKGDIEALGKLLNESHRSLKEKYEVSCFELDVIAETAQKFPSCAGARMTGAGFGGSAIALVKKADTEEFEKVVGETYKNKTGYDASFYEAEISDGIIIEKIN